MIGRNELKNLEEILGVMQEIKALESQREWERERMVSVTQHLTGMPSGGEPHGLDSAFARLAELDERHEALLLRYADRVRMAQDTLSRIEDGNTRAVVVMKWILHMSDAGIRRELSLSRRRYDAVIRIITG